MAPQSKKRKAPQATLHNFFSPDAITAIKKPRAATRPSEEVIIIDSDSDGHAPVSKKGKRGSTQVKVVDEPASPGPSNLKFKDGRVTKGASSSFGTPTGLTGCSVVETSTSILDDEDMPSFGEPSSLLRASTSPVIPDVARTSSFGGPSHLLQPRRASSPAVSSSFGAPVSLLRDTYEARPSEPHDDIFMLGASSLFESANGAGPSRPSVYPIQEAASSSNFTDLSVKGIDDENDWAMGDDEMALVDPEPDNNDEEDVEIEIESSSPECLQEDSEGVSTCPICALHLVGLFVTVSLSVTYTSYPSLQHYSITGSSRSC